MKVMKIRLKEIFTTQVVLMNVFLIYVYTVTSENVL